MGELSGVVGGLVVGGKAVYRPEPSGNQIGGPHSAFRSKAFAV